MSHPRRSPISGFRVELLGRKHDRSAFTCGVAPLDDYIKSRASQDAARNVAVCFVATPDGVTIAGFYTVSQFSIHLAELPDNVVKKMPRYPDVPATLLGRLATASAFTGRGLGEFLLLDALHRSWLQSREIASVVVVVDAKDEKSKAFYEHFGFIPLPRNTQRLFLPMTTIARLFD